MHAQIFSIANTLALLAWVVLIIFPKKKLTRIIIHQGVFMALLGVAYLVFILQGLGNGGGFDSIESVRQLFASDAALLAGWLHYLAFDLFVGAWMTRDARRVGVPHWAIILPLILTFMAGPVGFLIYFIIRLFKLKSLSHENAHEPID